MGVGIFPVFKPNVPQATFNTDGKVLAAEFGALDDLAGELGLPSFSSFGDNRPFPDDFDGDPEDYFDELEPFDEWFAASQGISVFSALAESIGTDTSAAALFRDPEDVLFELQCLVSCLQVAQEQGASFHLELA